MEAARCPWPQLVAASQCGGDDGSVEYRSSSADEQAAERELFAALLTAAPQGKSALERRSREDQDDRRERAALEPLVTRAAQMGLQLILCEDTAVVVEQAAARRGRGAYVIALGSANELAIEIPHSFSDLHTLPMGEQLFTDAHARLLAVSTVHRRGQAGFFDTDLRTNEHGYADVAHDPSSTFQAMTLAWLDIEHDRPVVQLHGFADRRVDADVVVSAGAKERSPWAEAIRDRLRALMPGHTIAAYPDDVDDLGATTNSQGRALRAGNGRFLHVEMNATLRKSLMRHAPDRGKYLRELASALLGAS